MSSAHLLKFILTEQIVVEIQRGVGGKRSSSAKINASPYPISQPCAGETNLVHLPKNHLNVLEEKELRESTAIKYDLLLMAIRAPVVQ